MSVVDEDLGKLGLKASDEWRIGFILIRSKRLKKDEVIRIVQWQRQNGMRFGDAAIELGLLSEEDVKSALSMQFEYPYVTHGESQISKQVIAAYNPQGKVVESLRGIRSKLMQSWFDTANGGEQKTLSIISMERSVGRSWLAANLAVTFSQLRKNTVLIDGDLRNPTQHNLFGLDNQQGLTEVLCGRASSAAILKRNQVMPNLAVIPAGAKPPNPQEVIARDEFPRFLEMLKPNVDVIIVDTPADEEGSDGQIIAGLTGGAVLVAKRHVTPAASLRHYVASVRGAGTALALSVLVN